MERKLASIQMIKEINPIPEADAIERATILGWQCVVKKGEFKPGDLCIYCEVDSLLPCKPEFEFLRKSCFNSRLNGFRIKTVKLRGQISQGIAFPLRILLHYPESLTEFASFKEGDDVTDILEIRKYEPEIPVSLGGDVNGAFPSFIPKTDETRIQSVPNVLTRHSDVRFVVTEKLDGTSSTFYFKDGQFGVCGRNWEFKAGVENTYWEIAKKYDLENKLLNWGVNVAIQGEIVGPGIQKNKYALSEHKLFVFNMFMLDNHGYCWHEALTFNCQILGLDTVPIINENFSLNEIPSIEAAVNYSIGPSLLNKNIQREGVVIKTLDERITDHELGRLSFKIINPNFLLKYEKDEE